jgi:hypothetical protein
VLGSLLTISLFSSDSCLLDQIYPIASNKNQWTAIEKWGYINSAGIPYKLSAKIKGVKSIGKKGGAMFDDVTPFVNGIASIYINKRGWKHIDTDGKERYILIFQ